MTISDISTGPFPTDGSTGPSPADGPTGLLPTDGPTGPSPTDGNLQEPGRYLPNPSERVREQVRLYEASDGTEGGTLEGKPVVILTHTGAKTSAVRKNPIMRIPDGRAYIAVASAAGASTHPSWYFNLVAHPRVHVQDHAEHVDVTARQVHGSEKQRAWAIAETYWPHFPDYRDKAAGREIPIFLLEPEPLAEPEPAPA